MSNQGRKPVAQRQQPGSKKIIFTPRNRLDLPLDLQKKLKDQGLEYRWLDAKRMADSGNLHQNYWEVYRVEAGSEKPGYVAADGTVRSGTCILGVRSVEMGDAHREFNHERANRALKAVKAERKELLRDAPEGFGIDDETDQKKI